MNTEGDPRSVGRVAVAWSGLPWYAARLIRAGISSAEVATTILGTRPEVPMDNLERLLGTNIVWLEKERSYQWANIGPLPALFIHTGWNIPCFNTLADDARRHGGAVVGMIDNNFKCSLRQFIGTIWFRVALRHRFDAVWVPGRSGRRLMRMLGMPADQIYEGLYGADPRLFTLGDQLDRRPPTVLYVGQMIKRKGVDLIVSAFRQSGLIDRGWSLRLIGDGPDRPVTLNGEPIIQDRFLPAEQVRDAMQQARIFVLASREEHWGVVLAEAGLSGCALLPSDAVGAAADLVGTHNGLCFKSGSALNLAKRLNEIADWDMHRNELARNESRELAMQFGPDRWAAEFVRIIQRFRR